MRRLVALVIAALLAVGIFAPVQADGVGIDSCSQASYSVWEFKNFGGDGLHVCYPVNFANLANVTHVQAGTCFTLAGTKTHDDWDNCLSSAKSYVGSEGWHWVCFFTGTNYTGTEFILLPTGSVNFDSRPGMDDAISSIKWC